MRPTMVQMPDDLVKRLDQRAQRDGVSRSRLVRDAVESLLAADQAEAIAAAYEVGYPDMRPAEDLWGDIEALHDELEAERGGGRVARS